jgi:hypothetical protein
MQKKVLKLSLAGKLYITYYFPNSIFIEFFSITEKKESRSNMTRDGEII